MAGAAPRATWRTRSLTQAPGRAWKQRRPPAAGWSPAAVAAFLIAASPGPCRPPRLERLVRSGAPANEPRFCLVIERRRDPHWRALSRVGTLVRAGALGGRPLDGDVTTLLTGGYRAGYWRGPDGCPPECPKGQPAVHLVAGRSRGPRKIAATPGLCRRRWWREIGHARVGQENR